MDPEPNNQAAGPQPKPNTDPQGKPGSNPAPEQTPGIDNAEEGYVFYSVMPKNGGGPQVYTSPKVKIEEPQDTGKKHWHFVINKKVKIYIYATIGLAILLVAGFFAFSWYTAKESKQASDSLLTQSAKNRLNSPQQKTVPAATSTPPAELADSNWQKKYFGNNSCQDQTVCGPDGDPDHDGLSNADEYKLGTDPNNPDSDGDGLADGDEVNIFGSNPLSAHSANDPQYSDTDYAKGGYDFTTGKPETSEQLAQITAKMQHFGLHEPTIKTLQTVLINHYNFTGWSEGSSTASSTASSTPSTTSTTTPLTGIDTSINAEQDRDAQRSSVINDISVALVKYYNDNKSYPSTNDFQEMFSDVKVYMKIATNPVDPVNKDPYIYSYMPSQDGKDFTLSFYSEVAGQAIKKHSADGQKILAKQQADSYDEQRKNDLESLQTALLLYSSKNAAGNQDYVFPTVDKYQAELVPNYIPKIPKDPKTGQDYLYQVSSTFDSFTLKALLDDPSAGTTGYLCNEAECRNY